MTGDFTLVRRQLRAFATAQAHPLPAIDRLHAAEGLLRRLAASEDGQAFALRGELLRRTLATPAPAQPVATVSLAFHGPADHVWGALQAAAATPAPDAVRFDPQVMTLDPVPHTPRPTFHARLAARFAEADAVHVEVVVGPAQATQRAPFPALMGPTAPLRQLTPAAAFAEQVQALVDPTLPHFAPEALVAAWRLATEAALVPSEVGAAVQAAFVVGVDPDRLSRLLGGPFGQSKSSLKSWRRLARHGGQALPEVAAAVAEVRRALRAAGVSAAGQ